ncbi:MAG: haloacid dehalogenase type II [Proteobacteria bacterium]|nr:haloacid dehalogenase type II [Pseudomonadota bacterium]
MDDRSPPPIRALIFDVFGTLVDWHGGISRDVRRLLGAQVPDPAQFAVDWRAQYQPAMQRVRSGALPFCKLDELHRINLDQVLADRGLHGVDEATRAQLNLAWHRLDAWPDVAPGLRRLRRRFRVAPCSNGNISLMVDLARHNDLAWDAILGAELARDYKPKPVVYRSAAAAFDCRPDEVLMVAAHSSDLAAAAGCGLRTAHIARPDEHGPGVGERQARQPVDWQAGGLDDLATQLGG